MAHKHKSETQQNLDRKAQEIMTRPELQEMDYEKDVEHANQVRELGDIVVRDPDRQPFNVNFHWRHRKP
ncbi:MAG: hypothetical protein ACM3ZQ_11280 [Bacillota bacterium]